MCTFNAHNKSRRGDLLILNAALRDVNSLIFLFLFDTSSASVSNTVSSETLAKMSWLQKVQQMSCLKETYRVLVNIITRGHYTALAKKFMKDSGQSQLVIDVVLKQVEKECKILTSNKFLSLGQHFTPSLTLNVSE